jgi:hypothetical protein
MSPMEKPFKGLAPAIPNFKPTKKNKFGGGEKMNIKSMKPMKMKSNKPAPMLGVYKKKV